MKPNLFVLLGFVALAALLDLRVGLRGGPEPVSKEAMEAAAKKLSAMKRPGDLIVHSPLFTVRELQGLGRLKARPDLPAKELMRSRRVLLLDRRDYQMHGFSSPSEVIELPAPLRLSVFEPSGDIEVPLYDLHDGITADTMRVHRKQKRTVCNKPRAEGGFGCPGEPEWLYAAQRMLKIGRSEGPCVWAHPTTDGTIIFKIPGQSAPPSGRKLQLIVSSGMADEAVKSTPNGSPVYSVIEQGGRTIGRMELKNRIGWEKKSFNIGPDAPALIKVTTPKDGRRHHCVNAQVIEVKE